MKFRYVRESRPQYSVKKMCQCLHISRSGYYAWRGRGPSRRTAETAQLRQRIIQLYKEHNGFVGSPMLAADLRSDAAFAQISRQRVARHMQHLGLRCRFTRKFVVTTDSNHAEPPAENLLARKFSPTAPDIAWVTDITYFKVGQQWNYLTVFIDLYSRIVVGWDISDSLERHSAIRALRKAARKRRPPSGLLVHSDRGVQFASHDFRQELTRHGCVQSMSRKGNCWDNAVAESFFHTLKAQCIPSQGFATRREAELALFQYIEMYYNRRRRHSANGWLSPAEFEQRQILQRVA